MDTSLSFQILFYVSLGCAVEVLSVTGLFLELQCHMLEVTRDKTGTATSSLLSHVSEN